MRLPEAKELIQKALTFAPGDPFISDSLAWVEFRMGNKAEALRILDTAYKARPDAEIAAHLGEVLWSLGQRDRAQAIWREGLLLNSENDTLQETLKRLRVQAMSRMRGALPARCWLASFALALLAGCASPPRATGPVDPVTGPWSGRLALQVQDQAEPVVFGFFRTQGHGPAPASWLFSARSAAPWPCWRGSPAQPRSTPTARHANSTRSMPWWPMSPAPPFRWRPCSTGCAASTRRSPAGSADLSQLAQGRVAAKRLEPTPRSRPAGGPGALTA